MTTFTLADAERQVHTQRARASRRTVFHDLTPEQWLRAVHAFESRCAYCGIPFDSDHPLTVDHYIPVSDPASPGNTVSNVVPACDACNNHKDNRQPLDWLAETFGVERASAIAVRIERYFKTVASLPQIKG